MKFQLLAMFFLFNINLYSQCSGCNKNNQKLNIWDIDYFCDHKIEKYQDCDEIVLELNNIISNSGIDESIANFGFQKWNDDELELFALFDNRYKISDHTLKIFQNVNHMLLDGVEIPSSIEQEIITLNGEYILLIRNNLSIPLARFKFSKKLKYISLDENKLYGEIPERMFEKPELINLSIEFNNIDGVLSENLSGLKNIKYLTINNNNMTGSIPESICGLNNLKVLHLQYNQFDKLPDCMCAMKKKGVDIELYGNKFCEDIPKCLEDSIGFQECY